MAVLPGFARVHGPVRVAENGRARLTDLGIARHLRSINLGVHGTELLSIGLRSCEGGWPATSRLWPSLLAGYGALGA